MSRFDRLDLPLILLLEVTASRNLEREQTNGYKRFDGKRAFLVDLISLSNVFLARVESY